jgi:TonB family protein
MPGRNVYYREAPVRRVESSIKTSRCIRRLILATILLPLVPHPSIAMIHSASTLYLQDSGAGAPLGRLNVPSGVMAGRCITMVSPTYPQVTNDPPGTSTVIVRAVISRSGNVSPMRVLSGPQSLGDEAMNVVRLWRYKPYLRDGEPLDVTTDIRVDFDPAKPAGFVTHPNH